jgi:hypothetical protein
MDSLPSAGRRENALKSVPANRRPARRSLVPAIFTLLAVPVLAGPAFAQQASVTSETLLPANTTGWVSVPDAKALKAAIEKTEFGAMMDDPNVKPFVDDLARQLREYLDQQNIRFGMRLEDIEKVHSGEICLAGVLRKPVDGAEENGVTDHAIVLLVDVSDSREKAEDLLTRVAEELRAREATESTIEVGDVKGSKWAFKKPRGLRQKQFAFHALVGDWLLATDNEATFRDIIQRIDSDEAGTAVLAGLETFRKIFDKCSFETETYTTHVRWFVEPFGYVQLAQAIADAQNSGEGKRNNIAEKFHEEGFSAIKGVGGVISFATGPHEACHRTFVYAPPVVDNDERYLRAAAMLDFRNPDGTPLDPPVWVPANSAGFLTFTWDIKKALDKVGYIVDKTSGSEGSFQRALDSMKTDPQGPEVDIPEMVGKLQNRITVCSVTETPIDDESERIVFGIEIRDAADEEFVSDAIFRLVRNDAEVVEFEDVRILVVDTAEAATPDFDFEEDFDDEFGGDPLAEEEDVEQDQELKPAKPLFEKRVFAVKSGFLLIGNNLDQVKTAIQQMPEAPGEELAAATDYVRISEALASLSGEGAPSFRHFGRLDKALQTNYEMMRSGRMPQSKTILAQLLNRAYTAEDAPEDFVREQQVDGSRMPEDYEGQVAPYLGPAGLVVHSLDDGWLVTGVVLRKNADQMNTTTDTSEELAVDHK